MLHRFSTRVLLAALLLASLTTAAGAQSTPTAATGQATPLAPPAPQPLTCPPGWECDEVGAPAVAGDQALTDTTWTVRGAGSDIGGTSDQFHFVSEDMADDSSLVARLTAQQDTNGCAKAGVMYRASTDADAVNYAVVLVPHCGDATPSVQVTYRSTTGGGTVTASEVPASLPLYLQASRTGDTFTASVSSDGVTWTPIANSPASLPDMPSNAMVGLAVTSHNTAATSAAILDNVHFRGVTDLTQLDTETEHYTQTAYADGRQRHRSHPPATL